MAAYVTYSFYTSTFLGTAIASADFSRLALRASAVIDQLCFGRAAAVMESEAEADAENQEKIQLATCAVAEQLQLLSKSENGGEVASERVGNYSVSYVQNSSSQLSDEAKIAKEAKVFLWDTGLMYRGFTEEERGIVE